MNYITGDAHGDFNGFIKWAKAQNLTADDTIIILGDHAINWSLDWKDYKRKKKLAALPCNIFAIRGNHDWRPQDVIFTSYPFGWSKPWPAPVGRYETFFGNDVLVEDACPNIKHAIDGLIYNINNYDCLVIGGGYSVDKWYRLENGWTWVQNEQLDTGEMYDIMETYLNNNVDIILSHVAPSLWEEYIRHLWMNGVKGGWEGIDKSMENWMNGFLWADKAEELKLWYFAHNHANLNAGPIGVMLYDAMIPFGDKAPAVWDSNNQRERKY